MLQARACLFPILALHKVPETKAAAARVPTPARYLQQALEGREMLRCQGRHLSGVT